MKFARSVFKAYDIRGAYPAGIDEALATAVGHAFGRQVLQAGERAVALGRDGRLSGAALAQALSQGLLAAGVDVIDLGRVTTPMMYFATHTLCASGVQVTASHNPSGDNGFKLVRSGRTVFGADLQRLREAMEAEAAPHASCGTQRAHDILPAYRERIAADIRLARPMKVVLDCGNGVAGASSPSVLRAIGCEVVELYTEVDGRFPNHHPDPSRPENLRELVALVQSTGAELGLALDGDGDRLGVVTPSGQIVFPDRQMMLFARDLLSRLPGAPIVFDVKSTQRLGEAIAAAGGQPVMHKSGYAALKARMRELGAPLAGEMSGHVFFAERWYGFDDATYAACRLLEILAREADAGAMLEALPNSFATPELHVPCEEGEAHRVAQALVTHGDFPRAAQACTVDGLRLDWPDGFGLVRASNTTPVLTLRFEGHTPDALDRIEGEMMVLLRRIKPDARIAGAHEGRMSP
ncbi:phosphomannomutase/phosphoglucomutase [Ramlibacter rhizophilus]|uniref:Phosphomannomutase/phosphoglucomutase n=1 Tax=Ramlibacter rhizophilus TaxID=1781167 RepID=A0A4Z0BJR6_9BURK|nr:phosphomannomutase/phosphoglucomutase [Ramlibacter rhizophilus]TFY98653.1 phosphomannomutase/phosphoglucomutase [Ramlibacter rhizophilus]